MLFRQRKLPLFTLSPPLRPLYLSSQLQQASAQFGFMGSPFGFVGRQSGFHAGHPFP